MNHKEITEYFSENCLRLEKIIHIASMCCSRSLPPIAEDAFNDDWDDVCRAIGIDPPDNYIGPYEMSARLYALNKLGFLIQAATPILKFKSQASSTSSWEYYTTKWIYAESLDEAIEKAKKWAFDYYQNEKIKQGCGDEANE